MALKIKVKSVRKLFSGLFCKFSNDPKPDSLSFLTTVTINSESFGIQRSAKYPLLNKTASSLSDFLKTTVPVYIGGF